MKELCDAADSRLFAEVLHNSHHVLHNYLPPVRDQTYNTRLRSHNKVITFIKNSRQKDFHKQNVNKGFIIMIVLISTLISFLFSLVLIVHYFAICQ